MHYFVHYNKNTGKITGTFRTASGEFLPKPLSPNEENLEVTDDKQIKVLTSLSPRTERIVGLVDAGKIRTLKAESLFHGRIELSCNLPDLDGDGLPELPANGEAVARIKAILRGAGDKVLSKETTSIQFQVNRGILSHRRKMTEKGVAEVELRAVVETVRIRIIAMADGYERASMDIETIPIEEYRALVEGDSEKAE